MTTKVNLVFIFSLKFRVIQSINLHIVTCAVRNLPQIRGTRQIFANNSHSEVFPRNVEIHNSKVSPILSLWGPCRRDTVTCENPNWFIFVQLNNSTTIFRQKICENINYAAHLVSAKKLVVIILERLDAPDSFQNSEIWIIFSKIQ